MHLHSPGCRQKSTDRKAAVWIGVLYIIGMVAFVLSGVVTDPVLAGPAYLEAKSRSSAGRARHWRMPSRLTAATLQCPRPVRVASHASAHAIVTYEALVRLTVGEDHDRGT